MFFLTTTGIYTCLSLVSPESRALSKALSATPSLQNAVLGVGIREEKSVREGGRAKKRMCFQPGQHLGIKDKLLNLLRLSPERSFK